MVFIRTNSAHRNKETHAQKLAKQWLTKGGIAREDSDDELGYDDLPWEWIYEDENKAVETSDNEPDGPKKRRNGTRTALRRKIIGARMGSFQCKLGQTILLKSPEAGKDWVGIICEFLEEEDEDDGDLVKSANIMWFASPDEFLSTKNKKRSDALPKEQYITVDFNINPLSSIDGKATVLSENAFYQRYPNGDPPRGKAALANYNKSIICRRGVNQLQGKYTEEFDWDDIYEESEQGVFKLIDTIKSGLKRSRKRKAIDADVSHLVIRFSQHPC